MFWGDLRGRLDLFSSAMKTILIFNLLPNQSLALGSQKRWVFCFNITYFWIFHNGLLVWAYAQFPTQPSIPNFSFASRHCERSIGIDAGSDSRKTGKTAKFHFKVRTWRTSTRFFGVYRIGGCSAYRHKCLH